METKLDAPFSRARSIEDINEIRVQGSGDSEYSEYKDSIPLSNDNILLRGMSLRNTQHIIGVVVYTGHETKI